MRKSLLVVLLAVASMTMLFGQSGDPASSPANPNQINSTWTQLPIPPTMNNHLHTIVASSDGYVYASSDNGVFRAAVANPTVWTAVNNGMPKISNAYPPALRLGVTGQGTLLAGLGYRPEYGIARLDPKTLTWSMAKGPKPIWKYKFHSFHAR